MNPASSDQQRFSQNHNPKIADLKGFTYNPILSILKNTRFAELKSFMPKVFDEAGFTGRFYMADLHEPIHIHVTKDGREAKFWISPIACANSGGFSRRELRQAEALVQKYISDIVSLWHGAEEARKNAGRTS